MNGPGHLAAGALLLLGSLAGCLGTPDGGGHQARGPEAADAGGLAANGTSFSFPGPFQGDWGVMVDGRLSANATCSLHVGASGVYRRPVHLVAQLASADAAFVAASGDGFGVMVDGARPFDGTSKAKEWSLEAGVATASDFTFVLMALDVGPGDGGPGLAIGLDCLGEATLEVWRPVAAWPIAPGSLPEGDAFQLAGATLPSTSRGTFRAQAPVAMSWGLVQREPGSKTALSATFPDGARHSTLDASDLHSPDLWQWRGPAGDYDLTLEVDGPRTSEHLLGFLAAWERGTPAPEAWRPPVDG